jgi:hypothetical protein
MSYVVGTSVRKLDGWVFVTGDKTGYPKNAVWWFRRAILAIQNIDQSPSLLGRIRDTMKCHH